MKEIIKRVRKAYRVTGERQITCEVSLNFEMCDITAGELKESIASDNHNNYFEVIENCTQCDIPPREKWELGCDITESLWKETIHPSCPIINQPN